VSFDKLFPEQSGIGSFTASSYQQRQRGVIAKRTRLAQSAARRWGRVLKTLEAAPIRCAASSSDWAQGALLPQRGNLRPI